MKKCPYCAELIQDDAIVCRYCGRGLTTFITLKPQLTEIKQRIKSIQEKGNVFNRLSIKLIESHSPKPINQNKQYATVPLSITENVDTLFNTLLLPVILPIERIREYLTLADYNELQSSLISYYQSYINVCVGIGVEYGGKHFSDSNYIAIKEYLCESFYNITTELFGLVKNLHEGEINLQYQDKMLPVLQKICDELSNLGRENYTDVVMTKGEDGISSFYKALFSFKGILNNSTEDVISFDRNNRFTSIAEKSNSINIVLENIIQRKEIIQSMVMRKLSNPSQQDFFSINSDKINLLITKMGKSYSKIPNDLIDKIETSSKYFVPIIGRLTYKMQIAGVGDERFLKQTEQIIVEKFNTVAFFCFLIGVEMGKGFLRIPDIPNLIEYIRELFADELIQMIYLLNSTGKLDNSEAYNIAYEGYYLINQECIQMVAYGNDLSNQVEINIDNNNRTPFLNTLLNSVN